MEVVPALTPVTTPVDEPTVATPVALLLHVPPDVAFARVVVVPVHMLVFPVMGRRALMVTTAVMAHPPDGVYEIVVLPPATPVTTPVDPTVAMDVLLLVHVPLPAASVSVTVPPAQTAELPVIAGGSADTVTTVVA
jgi:hypothetical protein